MNTSVDSILKSASVADQRCSNVDPLRDANKMDSTKKRRQLDRSHITTLPGVPESYKCNICEKTFRNKKGVCYHDACVTGIKPYKCDICEKSFIKRSHYEYHERVHTGYKPFECSLCNKAFPQKNKLNRHMNSHTQEKQFFCQKCDKRYRHKEDLKSHMSVHSGLAQHVCKSCGKAFRISANLVRHMHTHSNERPYVCDSCKKSFKDKSLLIRHKKTHGKDRPFSCDHCNRFFLSKSELGRHLAIHTDIKPFSCTYCQTVFRRKDNLNRHIRHHHADNPHRDDSVKPVEDVITAQPKDPTPQTRLTSVTVAPVPNTSKNVRIRRNKTTKKLSKPTEIVSQSSVALSKSQPVCPINHRDEALRKDAPVTETATINVAATIPIPIRRPGELSNAVPVINGPIMGRSRVTDLGQRKKTFTHTEPIPLAEAVVINRRIEEKLYSQSSTSNLPNNYYFFRKHSTMSDSSTTHHGHSHANVVHDKGSETYHFNNAKPAVVTCNKVPILLENKRGILAHTRSLFSGTNFSSSTVTPSIRENCVDNRETEPRIVERISFARTESANSVPTIRINNGAYLHDKRTNNVVQTYDE